MRTVQSQVGCILPTASARRARLRQAIVNNEAEGGQVHKDTELEWLVGILRTRLTM